ICRGMVFGLLHHFFNRPTGSHEVAVDADISAPENFSHSFILLRSRVVMADSRTAFGRCQRPSDKPVRTPVGCSPGLWPRIVAQDFGPGLWPRIVAPACGENAGRRRYESLRGGRPVFAEIW